MTNSSEIPADQSAELRSRGSAGTLAGLLAIGLLLRLAVLWLRPEDLQSDIDTYLGLAESLAAGSGLSVPGTDQPTAFRPPLLPLLLAAGLVLGLSRVAAVAIVNLAAGLLTIWATWQLGRQLRLSPRGQVVATGIVVCDPLLLRYTLLPMTEVLSAALLTIAVWMMLKFQSGGRLQWAIAAGLCLGLGTLARPVLLITAGLLTLWGIVRRLRMSESVGRSMLVGSLPLGVVALVLLPWIVRNRLIFDDWIPATTHGGYTLLLGNNQTFYQEVVNTAGQPVWQGHSLTAWQHSINQQLQQSVRPGDEVAADRWMYQRAQQEIRRQPGSFLKACLLRWQRFWSLIPAHDSSAATRAAVGTWYAILWIGLAGTVILRRVRWQTGVGILWLAVLSFLLLHTFYWTNTRMRAPLAGLLAILSVAGWQGWLQLLQVRFVRRP